MWWQKPDTRQPSDSSVTMQSATRQSGNDERPTVPNPAAMCVAGHIASGTRGRLGGSASGFHATIAPQHDRVGNHVTTLTPFPAGLPTPACNPAVSPSDCTHSHAQRLSEPVVARWIIPWVFPTVFPAADTGILATLDTTTPSINLHNSLASKPPQTLLTVDFAEHPGC